MLPYIAHRVHLLITGGTIDSIFDGFRDLTVVNDQSVIPGYLERVIKPYFELSHEIVTLRDSRGITDELRADIALSVARAPCRAVIITHGTYTMADTAQFLSRRAESFPDKTVVFVGSFFPLKNFAESDAPFNLGFAIASSLSLAPGVYVAMNGRCFAADEVMKDLSLGRFVAGKTGKAQP